MQSTASLGLGACSLGKSCVLRFHMRAFSNMLFNPYGYIHHLLVCSTALWVQILSNGVGYTSFSSLCGTLITKLGSVILPYNGNHPRKKSFANLEAFANVFLHFLSRPEFLYMRLPEVNYSKEGNSRNFSSADNSRYTVFSDNCPSTNEL